MSYEHAQPPQAPGPPPPTPRWTWMLPGVAKRFKLRVDEYVREVDEYVGRAARYNQIVVAETILIEAQTQLIQEGILRYTYIDGNPVLAVDMSRLMEGYE